MGYCPYKCFICNSKKNNGWGFGRQNICYFCMWRMKRQFKLRPHEVEDSDYEEEDEKLSYRFNSLSSDSEDEEK